MPSKSPLPCSAPPVPSVSDLYPCSIIIPGSKSLRWPHLTAPSVRPYSKACRWILSEPMPAWAQDMVITPVTPEAISARIVFSALPANLAKDIEPEFASCRIRCLFECFILSPRAGCASPAA